MLHTIIQDTLSAAEWAETEAKRTGEPAAWAAAWYSRGAADGLRGWEEMPPETTWLRGVYAAGYKKGRDERSLIAIENWLAGA